MRTSTRQNAKSLIERARVEFVALLIDGVPWATTEEPPHLLLRLKDGSVPGEMLGPPSPTDVAFVRAARSQKWTGHPLPVERDGDTTKIGGVPIHTAEMLDLVAATHGPVVWRPWDNWLCAVDSRGEVVAIQQMADGYHLHNVILIQYDGAVWTCTGKFCVRMSDTATADVRDKATRDPKTVAALAKAINGSAAGKVVDVVYVEGAEDHITNVGPSRVPADQVLLIEATHGRDVVWSWTGPLDPVVASKAGRAVGLVMPIPAMAAGGVS